MVQRVVLCQVVEGLDLLHSVFQQMLYIKIHVHFCLGTLHNITSIVIQLIKLRLIPGKDNLPYMKYMMSKTKSKGKVTISLNICICMD